MAEAGYTKAVTASHRKFQVELKRAKTRQAVMNVYWKHKQEHERMLAKHLKEEMAQVNKVKAKIPHR